MRVSDEIACFISNLLAEGGGFLELSRGEIAERFSCAPSQINYVISTRFSPEHGYIVETRRGGGGYVRIKRVWGGDALFMHVINSIGDVLDFKSAQVILRNLFEHSLISDEAAAIMNAAITDQALFSVDQKTRGRARAAIFKNMLITMID